MVLADLHEWKTMNKKEKLSLKRWLVVLSNKNKILFFHPITFAFYSSEGVKMKINLQDKASNL